MEHLVQILTLALLALAVAAPARFDRSTGAITSERWRSGVPLGGIGCGVVELLTDGSFGNFTINHNWDRPTGWMKGTFAAVFADDGKKKCVRVLRLAGSDEYEGVENVAGTSYVGMFPMVTLAYSDRELPVEVTLRAFSPLIANNAADSSLPVACFDVHLKNTGRSKVTAAIALTWENILGFGGREDAQWQSTEGNSQEAKTSPSRGLEGVLFSTKQTYEGQRQNVVGQYYLAARKAPGVEVTTCPAWDTAGKSVGFWKGFSSSGRLGAAGGGLGGAVAARTTLGPGQEKRLRFLVVWFMPHHVTIHHIEQPATEERKEDVGHYYLNRFEDPLATAQYVAKNEDRLREETLAWQRPVLESNLPFWLKHKLINCAFSVFACGILTKDGRFAVMESPITMGGATGTMDQRMAAHAFYTQLFPELDMRELELFARCQDLVKPVADGRISHFDGNVHNVIGDPNVSYGVTDWPDLSCSFIMQVLKLYRWTGDRQFLDRMYPHVKKALAWLESADKDGDAIPEGGSTYDYEKAFPGAFSYSASCYLGALKAGIEIARVEEDDEMWQAYRSRFALVQKSMMGNLWNGKFFIKQYQAKTGEKNPNSFIAQLAGDWLSRLSGTGSTFPDDVTESVVRETIARHVKPFKPVPPMEVTPDGKIATDVCFVLQHEPYIGCEAIYQGYTDDGLDVIKRVYDTAWEVNQNPWHQLLAYEAPSGKEKFLLSYMTCPTTWHVLNALSGATLDVPAETLYIDPRTATYLTELHIPVYFSRFWCWLDYAPPKMLRLRVLRAFGEPVRISRVVDREGRELLRLAKPFIAKQGAVLNLDSLAGGFPGPKVVDYEVKAKE